jgi:hypothetical protein
MTIYTPKKFELSEAVPNIVILQMFELWTIIGHLAEIADHGDGRGAQFRLLRVHTVAEWGYSDGIGNLVYGPSEKTVLQAQPQHPDFLNEYQAQAVLMVFRPFPEGALKWQKRIGTPNQPWPETLEETKK